MAISANLKFKNIDMVDSYVKIRKVFGSAADGWSAIVGVAMSKDKASKNEFLYMFNVGIVPGWSTRIYSDLYRLIEEKFKAEKVQFKSEDAHYITKIFIIDYFI